MGTKNLKKEVIMKGRGMILALFLSLLMGVSVLNVPVQLAANTHQHADNGVMVAAVVSQQLANERDHHGKTAGDDGDDDRRVHTVRRSAGTAACHFGSN